MAHKRTHHSRTLYTSLTNSRYVYTHLSRTIHTLTHDRACDMTHTRTHHSRTLYTSLTNATSITHELCICTYISLTNKIHTHNSHGVTHKRTHHSRTLYSLFTNSVYACTHHSRTTNVHTRDRAHDIIHTRTHHSRTLHMPLTNCVYVCTHHSFRNSRKVSHMTGRMTLFTHAHKLCVCILFVSDVYIHIHSSCVIDVAFVSDVCGA